MLLNDKAYKTLKWIAQYLLPATGTLYFALAAIWGLPFGEQVIGTITALTIFLGVVLGISTSAYKKSEGASADGALLIDTSGVHDIYRLDLGTNLEILGQQKTITLTVKPNQDLSTTD